MARAGIARIGVTQNADLGDADLNMKRGPILPGDLQALYRVKLLEQEGFVEQRGMKEVQVLGDAVSKMQRQTRATRHIKAVEQGTQLLQDGQGRRRNTFAVPAGMLLGMLLPRLTSLMQRGHLGGGDSVNQRPEVGRARR